MRRTTLKVLSFALVAACISAAQAQDAFPDTPANHWAYEALTKLKKDGLLVGYPDGLFRGSRPASRYELAVSVQAAYSSLKTTVEGLQQQLANLPKDTSGADLADLKAALTELQTKANDLTKYADDIASLRKMADTFEKELDSLGVNVEALKKDLDGLAQRVTALEKKKPAVDISGDLNLWMGAGNSVDDHYGLNKDGRITGIAQSGPVSNVFSPVEFPAGLTRDVTILHEAAFTLKSTNEKGPKWSGTVVTGNMLSTPFAGGFPDTNLAFGSQSSVLNPTAGFPLTGYTEAPSDFYIQDLAVQAPGRLGNVPVEGEFGRIALKVNPLLFQRPDTTSYFSNPRWDDHKYRIDGGRLGFALGQTNVDVFGGRINHSSTVNGVDLFGLNMGTNLPNDSVASAGGGLATALKAATTRGGGGNQFIIDQLGGLSLRSNFGDLELGLAYLWLDAPAGFVVGSLAGNQVQVYGGNLGYELGRWSLEGHYGKSKLTQGNDNVSDDDDAAWDASLEYEAGKLELTGLYRAVEANYVAPGDWGRLGVQRNPTNVGGWTGKVHYGLNSRWSLSGSYGQDKGLSNDYSITTLLNKNSKIDRYTVGLTFRSNEQTSFTLGYESTQFKGLVYPVTSVDTSDPKYKWTSFAIRHKATKNTMFEVRYEVSDITNDFQVTTPGGGARFKGGFLTSQVTVKF